VNWPEASKRQLWTSSTSGWRTTSCTRSQTSRYSERTATE
jgi:hypothetical protein